MSHNSFTRLLDSNTVYLAIVNLKLYYYTVILLLHRPFSNLPTDKYAQSQSMVSESEKICLDAAKELSEVVTRRQNETNSPAYYAIFCSPTCFIYALFQSSLVFLSNALKTKHSSDTQAFYQSIHLIKMHSDIGPAPRAIEILNMLATINGLNPNANNHSPSNVKQKNLSCPTVPLTASAPQQVSRSVKEEYVQTQRFRGQSSNSSIEHADSRGSVQKMSTPKSLNREQHGSQYQPLQHQQHVTQTNYSQAYPVFNNTHAYSHQRSFSSDQLNASQQTYSQHHSRSISYDQLEMITGIPSFSRVDPKPSVNINRNNMNPACYTPQTNNSNHQQLMSSFNPPPSQTYNSSYNPNLNVSSTTLSPSNPNWSDWDVYLGHQNSSQQ